MKISTGQEYAAKIINTKKLSARGEYMPSDVLYLQESCCPTTRSRCVQSVG